jgi:hypothetical protein
MYKVTVEKSKRTNYQRYLDMLNYTDNADYRWRVEQGLLTLEFMWSWGWQRYNSEWRKFVE